MSLLVIASLAGLGSLGGTVMRASTDAPKPDAAPATASTPAPTLAAPSVPSDPVEASSVNQRVECAPTQLLEMRRPVVGYNSPEGRRAATVPARSIYLHAALWIPVRASRGDWVKVDVPWSTDRERVWIRTGGAVAMTTDVRVVVDRSARTVVLSKACKVVAQFKGGVGAPTTPTPLGSFFVSDLTQVPANQPQFGSFAFGLSTRQPHLPAGWTGGDQMALHGTNQPSSIGRAASTGCVRLREEDLRVLRRFVRAGTPVDIVA